MSDSKNKIIKVAKKDINKLTKFYFAHTELPIYAHNPECPDFSDWLHDVFVNQPNFDVVTIVNVFEKEFIIFKEKHMLTCAKLSNNEEIILHFNYGEDLDCKSISNNVLGSDVIFLREDVYIAYKLNFDIWLQKVSDLLDKNIDKLDKIKNLQILFNNKQH